MKTRASGFALIELMVVVSIVGVLASIAIPEFTNLQYRSRQSERKVLLQSIHNAVEDYYMRESHFPQLVDPNQPALGSNLSLWGNPSWANPDASKHPWRLVSWGDHWQALSLTVEGGVYYQYWGVGNEAGQQHQYWLIANGDLDQDSVLDQIQRLYTYQGIQLQHNVGSPNPACTWEWRIPGSDLVF